MINLSCEPPDANSAKVFRHSSIQSIGVNLPDADSAIRILLLFNRPVRWSWEGMRGESI